MEKVGRCGLLQLNERITDGDMIAGLDEDGSNYAGLGHVNALLHLHGLQDAHLYSGSYLVPHVDGDGYDASGQGGA